jgi:hypothetical protein
MKLKAMQPLRMIFAGLMFIQMPMLIAGNTTLSVHLSKSANVFIEKDLTTSKAKAELYDCMNLESEGLSKDAFLKACQGYNQLQKKGILLRDNILTIADFSRPSSEERLFIIDLTAQKILFKSLVAHGKNSGLLYAQSFSNKPETNKSSLGFYLTLNTYEGEHGVSLRLKGLEKNINDKAYDRAIVMHGASYVSKKFSRQNGFLGRSLGCPAIPDAIALPIIQTIKNGSLLFIYHPSKKYSSQSSII